VEGGKWKVESGEWRMSSGEWRVESGDTTLLMPSWVPPTPAKVLGVNYIGAKRPGLENAPPFHNEL
jgi:hypothetical protein